MRKVAARGTRSRRGGWGPAGRRPLAGEAAVAAAFPWIVGCSMRAAPQSLALMDLLSVRPGTEPLGCPPAASSLLRGSRWLGDDSKAGGPGMIAQDRDAAGSDPAARSGKALGASRAPRADPAIQRRVEHGRAAATGIPFDGKHHHNPDRAGPETWLTAAFYLRPPENARSEAFESTAAPRPLRSVTPLSAWRAAPGGAGGQHRLCLVAAERSAGSVAARPLPRSPRTVAAIPSDRGGGGA